MVLADDSFSGGNGTDFDLSYRGNNIVGRWHGLGTRSGSAMPSLLLPAIRSTAAAAPAVTSMRSFSVVSMPCRIVFTATTMVNVEAIDLASGAYSLVVVDANVAAGKSLTVDGGNLAGGGETLQFDGSAELDGSFHMVGGSNGDVLTGGTQDDGFEPDARRQRHGQGRRRQ